MELKFRYMAKNVVKDHLMRGYIIYKTILNKKADLMVGFFSVLL